MALRDPRNRSRNNASRRTTSATRSKRSATSAKYNPKPSSAAQRSSKKGTGSNKVTTGKGGKVTSPRLSKALDSVKTKVKTNPVSPTPRGAQGPRTAPQQGPSQRVSGLQGSRTKPTPTNTPPKAATPKVSRVGEQIRQAKAVQQANPGRAARAARNSGTAARLARAGAIAGGLYTAAQILRSSGQPGAAKMSRLGIGGNAPVVKPNTKPKPKPKPLPVDKKPIKAPPKKDSTVLAKKGGKEGVLRNGVFYQTGWSPAQRNRYQIQQSKNKK